MNLQILGAIVVGILYIASYVTYIRDIIPGKTKPERASWLIWLVLGTIALTSQYALGARVSLALVLTQTLGVTIIFILSLWRGVGLPGHKDVVAIIFACLGLVLWVYTDQPILALLIVIAIDAIGVYLTAIKAYKYPSSETVSAWALACLAGVVTVLTIGDFSIGVLLYPIYTIILNIVILAAIFAGKKMYHARRVIIICEYYTLLDLENIQ